MVESVDPLSTFAKRAAMESSRGSPNLGARIHSPHHFSILGVEVEEYGMESALKAGRTSSTSSTMAPPQEKGVLPPKLQLMSKHKATLVIAREAADLTDEAEEHLSSRSSNSREREVLLEWLLHIAL